MVAQAIDDLLVPRAAELVSAYYDDHGPFAGATFEQLGRNDPESIGTDDLLAVTLLDVAVKPRGVRQILGAEAAYLSTALRDLDGDLPLWEADDFVLHTATELWQRLCGIDSVDAVTAGKLLARKRPQLIPVVDKWVIRALSAPSGEYWASIRTALRDPRRRARIEACRSSAPAGVTTIRLLDVIIWMTFSESTSARTARIEAGYQVAPRACCERPVAPRPRQDQLGFVLTGVPC